MSVFGFRFALISALSLSLPLSDARAAGPVAGKTADSEAKPAADAAAPATETNGVKLLVLPYQPILRSVEQKKAKQATDFLTKELANTDGLEVMMGGVATDQKLEASLDAAQEHMKKADEAEAAKNVVKAIEHRQLAIAAYEKNASAIVDVQRYIEAHHLLARALMWSGDDKKAKAMLDVAARLAPTFTLAPEKYSRMYRRWFFETAKQIVRDRPGRLLVRATLPGAAVQLDGRDMDVAPVLIDRVVPGKHLITARVDGVPPFGAVVTIKQKEKNEFVVNFAGVLGGAEVGDVADSIAENKLPAAAVKKAVAAGKNAGAAFVVAGGLARDRINNDLNVHTFVVKVDNGQIKTLNPVDFDSEMLTAESDVIRVVRQVDSAVKKFDQASQMVAMIEKRTSGFAATTLNEVNGAPPRPSQRQTATRTSNGRRKVFRALGGSTIRIRDEEE